MEKIEAIIEAIEKTDLIDELKGHNIYCKEEKKEDWINELDDLKKRVREINQYVLRVSIESFAKAAQAMKMLAANCSWDDLYQSMINDELYEDIIELTCQIMINYSAQGLDYTRSVMGSDIENHPAVLKSFNDELEKQRNNKLEQ